jgi:hypothetical protein
MESLMRFSGQCTLLLIITILLNCKFAISKELVSSQLKELRLNELQYIGTHNSYHIEPDQTIDLALLTHKYGEGTKWTSPKLVKALAYSNIPLDAQLRLGIRTFELDIYSDEKGGRYSNPGVFQTIAKLGLPLNTPYDLDHEMDKPGFKVLHMVDIDVRSTCKLFTTCLNQIKKWSLKNGNHIPIIIQIESKSGLRKPVDDSYQPVEAPKFTSKDWADVEQEILSVFSRDDILIPDDVKGEYESLNVAIKKGGWPQVKDVLGKVMFILIHSGEETNRYVGKTLTNKLMFVNVETNTANASFAMHAKPHKKKHFKKIRKSVKNGYLTYTRADAENESALKNDKVRQMRAFSSGAQIISTDQPFPDFRLSSYSTQFPSGGFVRCNPILVENCE